MISKEDLDLDIQEEIEPLDKSVDTRNLLKTSDIKINNKFRDINSIINNAIDKDILQDQNSFGEFNKVIKFYHVETHMYYVLKTFISKDDQLSNEIAVAIFGTNSLRGMVPNFSLIYDYGFDVPYDNDLTYDYVIYEYIDGKELFPIFIYQLSFHDFKNIMIQIFNALYIANNKMEFTHYDLSLSNIIIKELDSPIEITYGSKKIISRYIPIFIDYGLSHIKYNGIDIGVNRIGYNKNFWLYDVYFIILNLYNIIKIKNLDNEISSDIQNITYYLHQFISIRDYQKIKNYTDMIRTKLSILDNYENILHISEYIERLIEYLVSKEGLYQIEINTFKNETSRLKYSEKLASYKFKDFIEYIN